ncbi:SNF2-related domain-containing protein, putative [Babesia ovata]|uniref:SNF2-related domain-containing protein, putative n=1 Tax=Babesia ovata TaxID=189622 RepID=A0A2H6K7Y3_9APIC|nr:SNF2-related domain-containing protein, putative [Babesia ovata]GBE59107.1 SNF2-related domain-containing protein, putative [Babesia ovata]
MQYRAEAYPFKTVAPPPMAAGRATMPPRNGTGTVFRRQNTMSRSMELPQNTLRSPFKPDPGSRAPMMMPRCSTASIFNGAPTVKPSPIMPPRTLKPQTKLMAGNGMRTTVLPQPRLRSSSLTRSTIIPDRSPAAMPRQGTGMSRKNFTPSSYVTEVFPTYNAAQRSYPPSRAPTTPAQYRSRANSSTVIHQGQRAPHGNGVHIAFKGRNQMKASSAQRSQSVFKEVVEKIKEHTAALPTIDAKDAAQLVGGFVSGTLSVLAHIVGDIRGDIINGLFKPEDPTYDAAKAYYYAGNNHPTIPTGMTQRIDYIEEIDKCTQMRAGNMRGGRRNSNAQRPVQPMHSYHEQRPEPVRMHHPRPSTFGHDPHMFSGMSERSLEEFLLNDSYLDSAPPSMPR